MTSEGADVLKLPPFGEADGVVLTEWDQGCTLQPCKFRVLSKVTGAAREWGGGGEVEPRTVDGGGGDFESEDEDDVTAGSSVGSEPGEGSLGQDLFDSVGAGFPRDLWAKDVKS